MAQISSPIAWRNIRARPAALYFLQPHRGQGQLACGTSAECPFEAALDRRSRPTLAPARNSSGRPRVSGAWGGVTCLRVPKPAAILDDTCLLHEEGHLM